MKKSVMENFFCSVKYEYCDLLIKVTVMQIEKALINDRLIISKVS